MSVIDLPDTPGARAVVPRVVDFGGTLVSALGAPAQRLNRLGSRYAIAVTMPPMRNQRDGRIWVNRLLRGLQEGVRMEYPLLDFDPGTPQAVPGTPVTVNGAGQAGNTLAIEGLQPFYAFREGQPVSVEVGGQHYLDFVAEATAADASGEATITLTQMLRVSPGDGDTVHVGKPMIEGLLEGEDVSWQIGLSRLVELEFTIVESA